MNTGAAESAALRAAFRSPPVNCVVTILFVVNIVPCNIY
jgi:hypothetical protein